MGPRHRLPKAWAGPAGGRLSPPPEKLGPARHGLPAQGAAPQGGQSKHLWVDDSMTNLSGLTIRCCERGGTHEALHNGAAAALNKSIKSSLGLGFHY